MSRAAREALAAQMAAPALFDEGIEATRNACVAGAPLASAAITAAAYYGNPLTGLPALSMCMARLATAELSRESWLQVFAPAPHPSTGDAHFSPGFGFISATQGRALHVACRALLAAAPGPRLQLYWREREPLEAKLGPLNHAGLCALVYVDHDVSLDDAERSFLLMRMEPALAEAQKTRHAGLRSFPFFENAYTYEGDWPAPRSSADEAALNLTRLVAEMGLDV